MRLRQAGFTLVELMIVMIVMIILVGLGIATMGNIQAQARDKERDGDVAELARGLEQRYSQGSSAVTVDTSGRYPSNDEVAYAMNEPSFTCSATYSPCPASSSYRTTWLPGTSMANFFPPSNTVQDPAKARLVSPSSSSTAKATLVAQDYYYYEAFNLSGGACTSEATDNCYSFTITYCPETAGCTSSDISKATIIKSKHR